MHKWPFPFMLAACFALVASGPASAQLGSIIQVTTPADTVTPDGFCSLREAIIASNTNGSGDSTALSCTGTGIDSIRFGLGSGTPAIAIGTTPLPMITDRVTIAGNTGGATRIWLDGRRPNDLMTGLHIGPTAANSSLRFLVLSEFATALQIDGAGTVLTGSYIGTDGSGMTSTLGNETGVVVSAASVRVGGSTGTTPGGACTGECNLISGNDTVGIIVDDGGDTAIIQGNFIGTNVLGLDGGMGNAVGINALAAPIGGATPAARNVISGNAGAGIAINGGSIAGNYIGTDSAGTGAVPNGGGGIRAVGGNTLIQDNLVSGNRVAGVLLESTQNDRLVGNRIGTAADGVTALPNTDPGDGSGHGVWVTAFGSGNSIGNTTPASGWNTIAFNDGDGVRIDGSNASGNTIRYNSIHDNGGPGIDNVAGANAGLAPPTLVVNSASTVSGQACNDCVAVDVYSDTADEGRIYEGSGVIDQQTGSWGYSGGLTGPNVTVTQTDVNGNTSAFSAPVACPDFDIDGICDFNDDSDGDGNVDANDNCILVANGFVVPDAGGNIQRDTDGDGYGNMCDADLDNSGGIVNFGDLALFRGAFGAAGANADFDGSGGIVNFADLAILRTLFGERPGPSGLLLH